MLSRSSAASGGGNTVFLCASVHLFPTQCPVTAWRQLEINHGWSIYTMETHQLEIKVGLLVLQRAGHETCASTPCITEKRQ